MGRVVHCKKEMFHVYIGRPSILGNIFTHLPIENTKASFQVSSVQEAVDCFKQWLTNDPKVFDRFPALKQDNWQTRRHNVLREIPRLKNKILGCWCDCPNPCHGTVLLELVEKQQTIQ